ncbi:unnamed protein product [Psylliodes chrysocephalus]|uniref:Poly [ADP-ribose] polymerase n=1 Tax=Psylliodes chrysocephalus TaxID=3402493 RepID=A0A9P0DG37_9CUCU|nr:unnamed protein product [Psylliodes chrysocephala]
MGNCIFCKIINDNEQTEQYVQPFISETHRNRTREQNKSPTSNDKTSNKREQINKLPTLKDTTSNEASKNIYSKNICTNINNLPQKVKQTPEMLTKFLNLLFDERLSTNAVEFHNSNKIYTLSELNEYCLEYRMITNLFTDTNKRCYRIQKIEKIFNPYLLLQYRMKHLEYVAKKKIMNERNMFHGTLKTNIDNICRNNFNWRLHGRHLGIRNGQGVNFTSVAYFATHYSDTGFDKVMIIANVLVGKSCQGSAGVSVPPGDCDTTTDHRQPPQVFVKTVSNTGRSTNHTNLGSVSYPSEDSTQNFFPKKKLGEWKQMVTKQIANSPAKSASAESRARSNSEPSAKQKLGELELTTKKESLEKANSATEDPSSKEPKSKENTLKTKTDSEASRKSKEKDNIFSKVRRKSIENTDVFGESKEKADFLKTGDQGRKSSENLNSGAYSDSTEPQESAETTDSIKSSDSSNGSLERSDIIRGDPNESLENLINDLEGTNEDSNSPDNLNETVLEMDQDESGDESPKKQKKK